MNKLGHLHGLPGMFTACLYAGALRYVRERNNEGEEEREKEGKGKRRGREKGMLDLREALGR